MLFRGQKFEQRRNLAAANQVGLANADVAKLHQHFVLLGDQSGKLFGGVIHSLFFEQEDRENGVFKFLCLLCYLLFNNYFFV